jgi:hypothetical protein
LSLENTETRPVCEGVLKQTFSRTSCARVLGLSVMALFSLVLGCKSGGADANGDCGPGFSRLAKKSTDDRQPPGHISGMARALIRDRMRLHGDDMNDLLWSVMFLDYESMNAISTDIAETPRFARPMGEGAEVNQGIPERFFELQDELQKGAVRLAEVARQRDGQNVAEAFANVAQTCVQCHSYYLDEPKSAPQPALDLEEGMVPEESTE